MAFAPLLGLLRTTWNQDMLIERSLCADFWWEGVRKCRKNMGLFSPEGIYS